MEIIVWGTRGSYPVCRPDVMKYGGNTTCMFLRAGKDRVIIDGGSGIVSLGRRLIRRRAPQTKLDIFLTHPHWDHVLGFPYFAPFYSPKFEIDIYGAESENKKIEEIFAFQHQEKNFPIRFNSLKSKINIHKIDVKTPIQLQSLKVTTYRLNHPGVDLGYRFESEKGTLVILTDLAPIENNYLGWGMKEIAKTHPKNFEAQYTEGLVEFIRGADVVMHDTNFTDEEIVDKKHWGHSTPTDALKLLSHLDFPPALVLTHHDPDHSDSMMDDIYQATKIAGKRQNIEVLIAKEKEAFAI